MSMLQAGCRALSLAAVLALGTATELTVFAQQPAGAQPQGLEEIVVTGSRIARRDFQSQSPIVTVDKEAFTNRTNIGLEATLDQLPQFNMTGAGSQSYGAASTPFPQANAAPGAATVNLRGLGLNRNLVLLDGRRAQPVNGYLVVDLNTIPAAAIDRVEVITGGAAAVYGADAIAGVVNFILKKNFEGVQVNVQSGISQEGDGQESTVNGLLGATFADGRGSVMIGADYSKRDNILSKDRDWVVKGWNDPATNHGGLGSSNLSAFATSPAPPTSTGGIPPGGYPGYPLSTGGLYYVDQNGKVFDNQRPLDPNHPYTGPLGVGTNYRINPDGTLAFIDPAHSYLQIPLERYSLFGSGHIQLADKIEVFTQMTFSETYTEAPGFVVQAFNIWSPTVPYRPAYDDPASPTFGQAPPGTPLHPVSADLAKLLNQRCTPAPCSGATNYPWTYQGGLDYLGNYTTNTTSDVYQIVGGLRSDFTVGNNDWSWNVYASHGNTNVNAYQPQGFPYLPRLQNLFNANQYGVNFDISSLPGYSPVAVTGHCTSGLPIFNPNGSVNDTPTVSKDCFDYTTLQMNSVTTLEQNIFEGTITGTILNMAGGPLQFAAGADYRKEIFAFQPDSGYNANQDFGNVIGNVVLPVSVNGSTDVKEVYGELAIPLFKGNRLEIDPGIRYSDYDTVGKTTTYKLLGTLKLTDRFRLRGGYQYANRAPNVVELFTPKGGSSLDFNAPDLCGSWVQVPAYGNVAANPNRLNVQTLCQQLMVREGAPASFFVPGSAFANSYQFNVFGAGFYFPLSLAIQEGNKGLSSETSDTYTAGVVMSLANRLTVTLDWYQVQLDNAIAIPGHAAVYQQCFDAKYNPLMGSAPGSHTGAELAAANPFCALIQREWVGGVPLTPGNYGADRKFKAQYINSGGINTEGYDVQVDWGIGNFNVNFQAGLLDLYEVSPFPGAAFVDYTGTTFNDSYDYRFLSTVRWGKGPLSVGARLQYLPGLKPQPGAAAGTFDQDSYERLDVFGSWTFKQHWQLRGGIDNALNVDPVWVGANPQNHAVGVTNGNYDQIGRRLYLAVQVNL
jgi:iron complex outermembrane recepter protein